MVVVLPFAKISVIPLNVMSSDFDVACPGLGGGVGGEGGGVVYNPPVKLLSGYTMYNYSQYKYW